MLNLLQKCRSGVSSVLGIVLVLANQHVQICRSPSHGLNQKMMALRMIMIAKSVEAIAIVVVTRGAKKNVPENVSIRVTHDVARHVNSAAKGSAA